jgi:hypothetical protein
MELAWSLLVFVLVIGLCFYIVNTLGPKLTIPDVIITILNIVIVIFIVLWIVGTLAPHALPLRLPWG